MITYERHSRNKWDVYKGKKSCERGTHRYTTARSYTWGCACAVGKLCAAYMHEASRPKGTLGTAKRKPFPTRRTILSPIKNSKLFFPKKEWSLFTKGPLSQEGLFPLPFPPVIFVINFPFSKKEVYIDLKIKIKWKNPKIKQTCGKTILKALSARVEVKFKEETSSLFYDLFFMFCS